ncbi:UNVERIFIED_CONTAM: hypothetical protein FKN15_010126 [Acipenser sinensis]
MQNGKDRGRRIRVAVPSDRQTQSNWKSSGQLFPTNELFSQNYCENIQGRLPPSVPLVSLRRPQEDILSIAVSEEAGKQEPAFRSEDVESELLLLIKRATAILQVPWPTEGFRAREYTNELVRLLPKRPPPVHKPAANWHPSPRSLKNEHSCLHPLPEVMFGTGPLLLATEALIGSAALRRDRSCRPSHKPNSSPSLLPQAQGPFSGSHMVSMHHGHLGAYYRSDRLFPAIQARSSSFLGRDYNISHGPARRRCGAIGGVCLDPGAMLSTLSDSRVQRIAACLELFQLNRALKDVSRS